MTPRPLIQARGLVYSYDGANAALNGIDFDLHEGETVALLGPNGCGKTTFLLSLIGVLQARGEVAICGLKLAQPNYVAIRRKAGVLFQDPHDQLFMPTIIDDVAFGPAQVGLSPEQSCARAAEALRQVGMPDGHERPPYQLSGGEKQRVALAGLIAAEPEILLLDEPTTHLDPPARRHLLEILRALPQAKVLATHDVEFARSLAHRAVFFEHGRVAASGSVDDVIARFDWS